MNLTEIREKISRAEGQQIFLNKTQEEAKTNLIELIIKLANIEEAQKVIQITAKETQEKLQYHIEDIVQSALDSCFPGKYIFRILFELKRGRTEARLFIEDESGEYEPMISNGGGLVDIISFALRIAVWSLSRTDNVIILDEPFKFLSANLRPLAGGILKKLSNKLKLQFILVTHDNEMINIADKIFEIDQKNGVSYIK